MEVFDMNGTPKQVAWAESVISDAVNSIANVANANEELNAPCQDLIAILQSIEDAAWIIACRNTLGLKLRGGQLDIESLHDHQLFRDERWRNPALRKGRAGVAATDVEALKRRFLDAR